MKTLKNIINIVLKNRNRLEVSDIDGDTNLRTDLGFDSLDLAELTVRIEDETGVDIFSDGIVETVGDIQEKIDVQK
jgi:acyl carrier protein